MGALGNRTNKAFSTLNYFVMFVGGDRIVINKSGATKKIWGYLLVDIIEDMISEWEGSYTKYPYSYSIHHHKAN